MHLTTTSAKHMTEVIRTTLAISIHLGTGNTNLTATNGNGTCTSFICTRDRFAISIKGVCAHRAHSTTAINIVYHMTTVYQHCRIATHDASIEVEVCLTISSYIGICTTTRTIDITTIGESCSREGDIIRSVVRRTAIIDNIFSFRNTNSTAMHSHRRILEVMSILTTAIDRALNRRTRF